MATFKRSEIIEARKYQEDTGEVLCKATLQDDGLFGLPVFTRQCWTHLVSFNEVIEDHQWREIKRCLKNAARQNERAQHFESVLEEASTVRRDRA